MLRLTLREGKPRTVTTPSGEVFSIEVVRQTMAGPVVAINWGPPFEDERLPAEAACDEPCGPDLETVDENSPDT